MRKITVISLALILFLIAGCGTTHSSTDGSSADNHISEKEAAHDGSKDIEEDSNHEMAEDTEDVSTPGSASTQDISNAEKTNGAPDSTDTQSGADNPDSKGTQADPDNLNSTDATANSGNSDDQANPNSPAAQDDSDETAKPLIINLTDIDGKGTNYTFTYNAEAFKAEYTIPENWKIHDSYLINSESDMLIICQALIDEHPIHGRDMVSFRTAEDMVYEWQIHNLAYAFLEDDDPFKDDCRDVDFDPKDQDLTIEEFYKSRTGEDFDFEKFFGAEP